MSATIIFDNRNYVSRLEQAGFTRMQAEAQAEVLTEHSETLRAALQPLLRFYEETAHRDLATKGDVLDTRLEIEKVRAEVEKVRADLKSDMAKVKYDLLKWQIGIGIALVAIMAKGFGWLGF